MSFLRNTTVRVRRNCRCRQPRNNSRDCADVNRRKSRRYMRYLRNFDGPLGLSGCRGNFFDVGNVSSLQKTMARVCDNCRCRQLWSRSPPSPFRNFAKNPLFARSFRRLSCVAAFRILLHTNTHHQMGQQEEPVVDTLSPRKQAIYMGHARTRVVRKVNLYYCSVILCGILCCSTLFVIWIVIKFIVFY